MKNVGIKEIIQWLIIIFILGIVLYFAYPDFVNNSAYIFIKDLLTFTFTAAGLFIANGGLFTWKKQIEYNKKDEAVNSLHFSLLKLRDAIKHVRNPAIFPSESSKATQYFKLKYPNKTETGTSTACVYEMRWEEIVTAQTEMESNLLRTEVLYGSEIRKLVRPIYAKITELNIALKQNFNPELRTKEFMEIHNVMYDKGDWANDKEDDFGESINKAIENVVNYMNSKMP